jgi:acetyltransferase-like isoleucine patch superfamily enzyme
VKAKIYDSAKIINQENLRLAECSQIDDFVFLNAGLETHIGRFVHISSFCSVIGGGRFYMEDFSGLSAGCRIITATDDFSGNALTNPTVPSEYTNVVPNSVHIGKHAILGTNVVVYPGVTIGEGAAVGAGSIVRKDLDPWTIYVGYDCQPLKPREMGKIQEMEAKLLSEISNKY